MNGCATLPGGAVFLWGGSMVERSDDSGNDKAMPREAGTTDADKAFDLFLRRGLHKLYDDFVEQPIPEDLLRLIEEDRKARAGKDQT